MSIEAVHVAVSHFLAHRRDAVNKPAGAIRQGCSSPQDRLQRTQREYAPHR
jgi:hypothetical protein